MKKQLFCLFSPLLLLFGLAVYHSTRPYPGVEFYTTSGEAYSFVGDVVGNGMSIGDSGGIVVSCDEGFKSCNLEKGRTLEDLMKTITGMVDFQNTQMHEALKACKEPEAPAVVLKETGFNLF
jgi:hypothetical protein